MSRLLHARFLQVRKDPLVQLGMVFMFIIGVVLAGLAYYLQEKQSVEVGLEDIIYLYMPIIGLMSGMYCSYLSGQEYYDGTIRNKLIVGHTRVTIYFSNLLINIIVIFCFWMVILLTETVLGLLLLKGTDIDIGEVCTTFLGIFLAIVALCAIFTLIAMSGQNHRTSDAVCLLLACLMLFAALYLMELMAQLKDYDEMTEEGVYVMIDKNEPLYPVIHHRKEYEFFYDLLPSGQIAQYVSKDVRRPERLPLCSAGIIVVTTAFGVFLFRRKNIQ